MADERSGDAAPDLDACAREPIHIPGSIQPQGALIALDGTGRTVLQASANLHELCGTDAREAAGRPLARVAGPALEALLRPLLDAPGAARGASTYVGRVPGRDGRLLAVSAHRHDGVAIVELEPIASEAEADFSNVYVQLREFVGRLAEADSAEAIASEAATHARALLGFDRVLVYRFDEDWHGHVIAEDRNERLPSYLGLHFPASDIPAQARALYRSSRVRLIADAGYVASPLVPALRPDTGAALDLSYAMLRSVSPVHLEYMRNMGTAASMSVSILVDGELWGLLSCHHAGPRRVSPALRAAADHLGQLLGLQLQARIAHAEAVRRAELRSELVHLMGRLAEHDDLGEGLARLGPQLLRFADADGAAIVVRGRCERIGTTPPADAIDAIVAWLGEGTRPDVQSTDALGAALPALAGHAGVASGLLAMSLSKLRSDHVLWFRREVPRTMAWGGDPAKPALSEPADPASPPRLHPRRSFERWTEVVRGRSRPWLASEVEAAARLREAIVGVVLRRAEEMAALTEGLKEANSELEAFSYTVSHDLRAPLRHVAGYAELIESIEGERMSERGRRYLAHIRASAREGGKLVDDLLAFSQLGRSALQPSDVDVAALVREIVESMRRAGRFDERRTVLTIGDLPVVHADPAFLRIVLENLLSNAVKYSTGREPARIVVEGASGADEDVVGVKDNGIGFDMAYVHKLFGVFQRLHSMERFEGTGIGLATARRIVARHGGRIWAEGRPDEGAAFWFALPARAAQVA